MKILNEELFIYFGFSLLYDCLIKNLSKKNLMEQKLGKGKIVQSLAYTES